MNATYEINITPNMENDTAEVMIYRYTSGISGPFSEIEIVPISEIESKITEMGFKRTGPFSELCAAGFCYADAAPL
jgi:hypothetical protein